MGWGESILLARHAPGAAVRESPSPAPVRAFGLCSFMACSECILHIVMRVRALGFRVWGSSATALSPGSRRLLRNLPDARGLCRMGLGSGPWQLPPARAGRACMHIYSIAYSSRTRTVHDVTCARVRRTVQPAGRYKAIYYFAFFRSSLLAPCCCFFVALLVRRSDVIFLDPIIIGGEFW